MPSALALSPHGKLFIEESDESFPPLDEAVAGRIGNAFNDGNPSGLLHLATVELETPLPATFAFWRDFGRSYLTQLCHTPGLESKMPAAVAVPNRSELDALGEAQFQSPLRRGHFFFGTFFRGTGRRALCRPFSDGEERDEATGASSYAAITQANARQEDSA